MALGSYKTRAEQRVDGGSRQVRLIDKPNKKISKSFAISFENIL